MVNSLTRSKGNLPTDLPDGIYTLHTGAFILTSKPYTLSDSNFVTSCLVETKHKAFTFFCIFQNLVPLFAYRIWGSHGRLHRSWCNYKNKQKGKQEIISFILAFCKQCNHIQQFFLAAFPLLITTSFRNLEIKMDMIGRLRNPTLISQRWEIWIKKIKTSSISTLALTE